MFPLNPREWMFIVAVAVVTVTGMTIKYWRDVRRETAANAAVAATPPADSIQNAVNSGKH